MDDGEDGRAGNNVEGTRYDTGFWFAWPLEPIPGLMVFENENDIRNCSMLVQILFE